MNLLLFLLLAGLSHEITSWRIFHHGRMMGGNLGRPKFEKKRNYEETNDVLEKWFEQNINHFDPTDERTFKQRYFVNTHYYNAGSSGPVFLMIGGEGEASKDWMTQGAWVDYAEEYGALMFQVEHRFYGKTHPFNDLSTDNLRYLTSEQALEDLATFIIAMNKEYNLNSDGKWIAFGGSYPGSLAAWIRLKYPHLIHGAMSASGPLLAKVDFQDYFQVVIEALMSYSSDASQDCLGPVRQAISQIDKLLRKPLGQKNLNKLFNLCTPIDEVIDNPDDIANFFSTIADIFAGVVQYNGDNRIGHPKGSNITIDTICDIMINQKIGPPVNRLARVNDLLLTTYDQQCTDYKYDKMINALRNISLESESSEGGRQWIYQTCNEFGFFQTSSQSSHIFSDKFPVEFFIKQCRDIFGDSYDSEFLNNSVEKTNTNYGALDIEVTNVVFVHGSIDPWHALGITKTLNQGAPAIYIKGAAHCANMYPASERDSPQLKAARVVIKQLIGTWLRL